MIKFEPTRIIDGDTYEGTLVFKSDFPGYNVCLESKLNEQRVRLHVVDTPEVSGAYLEETETFGRLVGDLVELLFSSSVETHFELTQGRDSFGRWVGEVWITDEGGTYALSEFLLDNKLATVWDYQERDFYLNTNYVNARIEDCLALIRFVYEQK